MGGGGNSAAAQAAMGMPYTPADGNASDLGFYEGWRMIIGNLYHRNLDDMNPSIMGVSLSGDSDVFKIKSQNLADEGL